MITRYWSEQVCNNWKVNICCDQVHWIALLITSITLIFSCCTLYNTWMCYPSSGSTEWFSVGSVTSLWCSFFPNSSGFVNLGHPRSKGSPKSGKLPLSRSQSFGTALFSVCWSESTLMADTEGDGLCLIGNFSAFICHLFPVQRSQRIFFHGKGRAPKAQ